MKHKVTIKDVAKVAGVSATTVSYVLNNNENQTISEETKERVLSAAQELRYVPNYAARIMKNSESHCVGVVMNIDISMLSIADGQSESQYQQTFKSN